MQGGRANGSGFPRKHPHPLPEQASHRHRGHHHEGHGHHHDEPMTQEEAVSSLLILGQVALDSKDYESAIEAYASVLKIEPNETAFYNLGSLRARGLGARRDFVEGARLFHQAELLGNVRAGKLCGKCMYDYIQDGIDGKTPAEVYASMAVFVSSVYPEAVEKQLEVNRGLLAVAGTHLSKGEYAEAAKVFRAAAEFGNDGHAQYYLAVLYNGGTGVPHNDLAALYWLDCAVDNGAADEAQGDRDNMLDALRQSMSESQFHEVLAKLAEYCEKGTSDIPANQKKAAHWRDFA